MAATDLRVNLGAALRSLDDGDIVIEKGGVPVAVLSRYGARVVRSKDNEAERSAASYAGAVSKAADRSPEALAKALAAMEAGWAGIDADEAIDKIHRWREGGGSAAGRSHRGRRM